LRAVLPAVLLILSFSGLLVTASFESLWIGVKPAVERVNKKWANRALKDGLTADRERSLNLTITIITAITIGLVWIILAYSVVWFFQHLFR